jgi:hypothetical protein
VPGCLQPVEASFLTDDDMDYIATNTAMSKKKVEVGTEDDSVFTSFITFNSESLQRIPKAAPRWKNFSQIFSQTDEGVLPWGGHGEIRKAYFQDV